MQGRVFVYASTVFTRLVGSSGFGAKRPGIGIGTLHQTQSDAGEAKTTGQASWSSGWVLNF